MNIIDIKLQARKMYATELAVMPQISVLSGKTWDEFIRQIKILTALKIVVLKPWDQYVASVLYDLLNP